jgi:SWI/SNF-related matrix-associated actin-dependent regulator of chromatin subfamily A3
VNELRLICNHGVGNRKEPLKAELANGSTFSWSGKTAQSIFDQLDQINLATYSNKPCSEDLSSELSSEAEIGRIDEPRMNQAMQLLCHPCFADIKRRKSDETFLAVCNHLPRCASASPSCELPSGQAPSVLHRQSLSNVSSKVRTLVNDLCELPEETKSVVFSGWTRTFDMIQPILNTKGIRCVRLDGSLSERGRARVLKAFRNNSGIRILLATITCGGVGLDLTAASRAYIMEPQWNPMTELQALDRIHRLGQKSDVVTIQYIMANSWEEQVLKLQHRKQELADLALESGPIRKDELTYGRLQYLKNLVG